MQLDDITWWEAHLFVGVVGIRRFVHITIGRGQADCPLPGVGKSVASLRLAGGGWGCAGTGLDRGRTKRSLSVAIANCSLGVLGGG